MLRFGSQAVGMLHTLAFGKSMLQAKSPCLKILALSAKPVTLHSLSPDPNPKRRTLPGVACMRKLRSGPVEPGRRRLVQTGADLHRRLVMFSAEEAHKEPDCSGR